MAKKVNWIPTQEVKLIELMNNWDGELADTALQSDYEWPAAECVQTRASFTAFIQARSVYQAAPTTANRAGKDDLKRAAIDAMRKFARERIRNNSKMTDVQKLKLGVTVQDGEPSPVPVPDAGPDGEAIINAREPGVVKVRYLGAKPYGVDRVEIAWRISDTPLNSPEELTNKETFSRNPWECTFPADERGKKFYYSLRYLTREGASHWSDVREAVVP